MIGDKHLSFGSIDFATSPHTITGGLGLALFPDSLSRGSLVDLGKGTPLLVVLEVETAVTMTLSGGVDFCAVEPMLWQCPAGDTSALWDLHPIAGGGFRRISNSDNWAIPADATSYHSGNLSAGTRIYVPIPPNDGNLLHPFLRFGLAPVAGLVTTNGASGEAVISGGRISARISEWITENVVQHPSGYSV